MSMNFVTFNQDFSHLAVGTSRGFRIYTTDPFSKCFESKEGDITLLEMLFSTSLVALILSPRRLQITNTKKQSTICELTFPTTVLAVRMNRKRLVVILEDQIYLYDISNMKLLYTIETSPNPNAICALSPSSENCYLAYPLPQKAAPSSFAPPSHAPPGSTHIAPTSGDVLIFDTIKKEAINVVEAHRSPLSCITINDAGTLLATASDKGTIIRVFSVPEARKLYQFRRGSMPSRIYSMSFNATSTLLCVSSATDTVHVFKLTAPRSSRSASNPSSNDNNNNSTYNHRSTSPPIQRDRSLSPNESDSQLDLTRSTSQTSELKSRKPNGTLMGMIRRTSQNVGTSVAASVGAYLPHAVSEMWEPARDFAWLKIPKGGSSSSSTNGGGGGGVLGNNTSASTTTQPLRSVVAMSSNSPQVMVVTNEGHFYVFGIDLERGGEGTLVKVYEIGGESERLGASVVGSKAYE
ncbi:MAG: autophagy protein [Ramalina farinacea]|uniref:Autophagy-related protein 18 n=1 Tax=Ramalina farinacea TaxID=258253 RepID=A0AA43TSV6_9LECA|nr:autophagy protein [Ramalina farinacea]